MWSPSRNYEMFYYVKSFRHITVGFQMNHLQLMLKINVLEIKNWIFHRYLYWPNNWILLGACRMQCLQKTKCIFWCNPTLHSSRSFRDHFCSIVYLYFCGKLFARNCAVKLRVVIQINFCTLPRVSRRHTRPSGEMPSENCSASNDLLALPCTNKDIKRVLKFNYRLCNFFHQLQHQFPSYS